MNGHILRQAIISVKLFYDQLFVRMSTGMTTLFWKAALRCCHNKG